jgi:hypothetical protein
MRVMKTKRTKKDQPIRGWSFHQKLFLLGASASSACAGGVLGLDLHPSP